MAHLTDDEEQQANNKTDKQWADKACYDTQEHTKWSLASGMRQGVNNTKQITKLWSTAQVNAANWALMQHWNQVATRHKPSWLRDTQTQTTITYLFALLLSLSLFLFLCLHCYCQLVCLLQRQRGEKREWACACRRRRAWVVAGGLWSDSACTRRPDTQQ